MAENKGTIRIVRKIELTLIKHPMNELYRAYLPWSDEDFKKAKKELEKDGYTVLLVGLQELSEKDSS